jgi:hypothetical protein
LATQAPASRSDRRFVMLGEACAELAGLLLGALAGLPGTLLALAAYLQAGRLAPVAAGAWCAPEFSPPRRFKDSTAEDAEKRRGEVRTG